MQAENLTIQTTGSGLALMPVIPPSRGKKRLRVGSKSQTLLGVGRSASMAFLDNIQSVRSSNKVSAEVSTLPPVPRFPRQASAPPLPVVDLTGDLLEMSPEDLKMLLTNALKLERELIDTLNARLRLISNGVKRLEPNSTVSIQDISKLAEVFHEISASLSHTCLVESELGVRQRELEKRNLELSQMRRKLGSQASAFQQTLVENRILKDKLRELQDEHAHIVKVHQTEKQKFATFYAKLDALREGMKVLTSDSSEPPVDAVSKLKGSINALIRDLQDGKSEVAHKNKHISDLNSQIQRLNKKALRLTYKLNEIRNRKTTIAEQHLPQSEDFSHRQMHDPRTLQYRLEDLNAEQREFINDLMEHGTQALAHLQDANKTVFLESLVDKLLQLNEFVEQLHLLRPALDSICRSADTHALISSVDSELSLLANAEHCFYWVFDRTNDEVWTLRNGQEVKFRSDIGVVGKVLSSGGYLNTTDWQATAMETGCQAQSALVYPVTSAEQTLVGVVEIVNNFSGKFDADEEYLVETMLPAIAQTTVRAISASTAVRLNRMKEDLLKAVPSLCLCEGRQSLGTQVERLGARLFGVEQCRLTLVEGDTFVAFGPKGRTQVSRDMGISGDVSKSLSAEIVGDPYNDIRYNSIVDLASSLPVYFVPVIGTEKEVTTAVAVMQIPHKSAVKARVNDRSIRVDGGVAVVIDYFVAIISSCLQRVSG